MGKRVCRGQGTLAPRYQRDKGFFFWGLWGLGFTASSCTCCCLVWVAVEELKLRYQNGYIYIYMTINRVSPI